MESDWRFNVWDLGMTSSGWQLAARAIPTVLKLWLVKESATRFGTFTTFGLAPGRIPVRVSGPFPFPPGQHFPYGQNVLPD